ncbi:TraB/GumN family protein [Paenibacillus pasadenensis]|uniref:TraB/GumN family protein n=1 Tax=Paenibacillus pasadenensis TaxID=217090 RepID=UPI0020409D20|nr:TraB/GumN family protein [Paenibacillus pasadenensis]MCM3748210.1 TraB/GumN family protein [Paenibacillus pasadenensis]
MVYLLNKNTLRLTAGALLASSVLLANVPITKANEAAPPIPDISAWSIPALHEGEKYGIYPLEWYYDGFRKPITDEKYSALIEATGQKLAGLGFAKTGTLETGAASSKTINRGQLVKALYNALAQYDLPAELKASSADAAQYFQQIGVLKGSGKSLGLDQPATVEQAAVLASRLVEYAFAAADKGAKGLMWKVTHGGNTLYLLGSIHIGSPAMYPMHPSVKEAFNSSDSLWLEANLQSDPAAMQYYMNKTTFNDNSTIKDHIAPETYQKLVDVSKQMGIPEGAYDSYKPWVVSNDLSLASLVESPDQLAQAASSGIDLYFTTSAMMNEMPIKELEGIKFQADLLSGVPAADQEKELNKLLDLLLSPEAVKQSAEQFKRMQQLWTDGNLTDFSGIFSESSESTSSGLSSRLFGERDKNMAAKLDELLKQPGESTSFVVVGAGHFAQKGMVIDLLKEKGYNVEFLGE